MRHEKIKDKSELIAEAQEFIRSQKVVVLSTIDKENRPYAATVFYYLAEDDKFTFYFFTQDATKKFENLEKNNRAALTIFTEADPKMVQAQGSVWLVKDEVEAMEATSKLIDIASNSSPWFDPPIAKMKAGKLEVLKVEVDWLRYADFRQFGNSPSPFHQIIP